MKDCRANVKAVKHVGGLRACNRIWVRKTNTFRILEFNKIVTLTQSGRYKKEYGKRIQLNP